MINYEEINDFIIKVFNYYNGKINIFNNKAILNINWVNLYDHSTQGYSSMPNIVVINPMVIYRRYGYDLYDTKGAILETIIHELYHIDQAINYNLYRSDLNYNQYIEDACQLQVVTYIAGHTEEIYKTFDILFDRDYYKENINYLFHPGAYYQRRQFKDHLLMYLDIICDLNDEFGNKLCQFINYCIVNRKNITLNINDIILPVYIDGVPISIDDFNKNVYAFMYENGRFNFEVNIDPGVNNNLFITIKLQEIIYMCNTIMCKKV